MRSSIPKYSLTLAALAAGTMLLAACGYTPPPRTNVAAASYKTDLDACDAAVPDAVAKRNAKTGLAWIASPVTRWSQIDNGMNACMAGKGWGQTRTCTAEELRAPGHPNQVVTAAGIRCSEPGKNG